MYPPTFLGFHRNSHAWVWTRFRVGEISILYWIWNNFLSSHCGTAEMNPTRNYEVLGSIPGLAQWLMIQRRHELRCRSQMWLVSAVAVAVVWANSCSSDWTLSLGTSTCYGPKKAKKKKKKKKDEIIFLSKLRGLGLKSASQCQTFRPTHIYNSVFTWFLFLLSDFFFPFFSLKSRLWKGF